jgi:hypothetical protein
MAVDHVLVAQMGETGAGKRRRQITRPEEGTGLGFWLTKTIPAEVVGNAQKGER